MTAAQIFRGYVRFVGVGAIATAGIFGILKSLKIVAGSFAIAAQAFRHGEADGQERTDRDIVDHGDPPRDDPVAPSAVGVFFGTLGGVARGRR